STRLSCAAIKRKSMFSGIVSSAMPHSALPQTKAQAALGCLACRFMLAAALKDHLNAAAGTQCDPVLQDNVLTWHEAQAIMLRHRGEQERHLGQRKCGTYADMRAAAKGQISKARPAGAELRRKALGIEAVGILPKRAVPMQDPGQNDDLLACTYGMPANLIGLTRRTCTERRGW